MKPKILLASTVTMSVLIGFVFAVFLAIAYTMNNISWITLLVGTAIFSLIWWLISPAISTWMYRTFYDIQFYKLEDIGNKKIHSFIKQICDKHNIKYPGIGIIKDKNPTAFTYGSASYNAKIVLTEGLFEFLDDKEIKTVIAHELGHIVHKDFIVMTVASTLIQLLYQAYVILTRSRRGKSSSSGNKKGNILVVIGIASYVLYVIGSYLLLYLSRVREYYADKFAVEETNNPNALSSALIKIAYGISSTETTQKSAKLLNATRAQGIFDFKAAKSVSLVGKNANKDKSLIEKALLFDLVSPWAFILELRSTHPLVGKRIKQLTTYTQKPLFNFDNILNLPRDKAKLMRNFMRDVFINYIPAVIFILTIITTVITKNSLPSTQTMGIGLGITAVFLIIKVRYKFPKNQPFEETSIIECMGDIYASPIRGKPIQLKGKAIGKGIPGYIFGEDMIYQDKTGIIYLNYESGIPIIGNLMFAWKKLKKLLEVPSTTTGWFMRGSTHHLELNNFITPEKRIKSYARFWSFIGPLVLYGIIAYIITSFI